MNVKETITSETELTPKQLEEIIKKHFKDSGKDVTSVRFNVGEDSSDDFHGGYPTRVFKSATVVNKIEKDEKLK